MSTVGPVAMSTPNSHGNKPKSWVIARYFGEFNKSRRDRWVFGDRDSGTYLYKFAWIRIIRHQLVKGRASPDDPALAEYWAARRCKTPPPTIGRTGLRPYAVQNGRCSLCDGWLLPVENRPQTPREWEPWLVIARKTIIKIAMHTGGTPDETEARLVHAHCHRRHTVDDDSGPDTSAHPGARGACLSRMRGKPHVRF